MLRLTLLISSLSLVLVLSIPALPDPGHLALVLSEDEFDDYLEEWLAIEEPKWTNTSWMKPRNDGCILRVNGDLGQPQPVYLRDNKFLDSTGSTGLIHLNSGDQVYIACTGTGRTISHVNSVSTASTGWITCIGDSIISGPGWLNGNSEFVDLICSSNSQFEAQETTERCFNDNVVIRIGFVVDDDFHTHFHSCFDQNRLEVLYTWYEQRPQNAVHQTSVTRPGWLVGGHFPGVTGGINSHYTQVNQKLKIASYVGEELADKYVTNRQYLARGHLAAKTDFVFATGQRATFFFVNAAPQWQPFNAGNWNWLEQNLRARIAEANYYTKVYTGTFGVTQLRDERDILVDIYLYKDPNNNDQLPVPQYFYKVVYEPTLRLGTAFVGINNPYYTEEEARALTFCTDRCRDNPDFSWLHWQPDRIDIGWSFCCDIEDFRRTVPHLPDLQVDGLLV